VAGDVEALHLRALVDTLQALERALLVRPLDADVRLQYARALAAESRHQDALAQFDLLTGQTGSAGAAHAGAAACLLALGRRDEALCRYDTGRGLEGFATHPALEAISADVPSQSPPRLKVIQGGADNVVPIDRTPAGQPSATRVGFDDIAGLDDLKRTMRLQIIEPFLRPGLFAKFKKRAGGGVLLYGPPGCGKTMMARAVAFECRAEFIDVGISDVLNMYIGESERNLAALFDKARARRPSVLFFDELDALAFARSKASSEHSRQVVNEFLSQLDGFSADNQQVLILAATNMPWDVDSAMKRPGRFTRQVFVAPPDQVARARIVELKLEGVPHDPIDADAIAAATPHFSGADIAGVVELAKDYVLEEHITSSVDRPVRQADLLRAARTAKASTHDWLRTARNLVKYAGADDAYSDVDAYLKTHKLL
jgi:SpoVK/Ycf46/Vps4 family AAA+-type ATPase